MILTIRTDNPQAQIGLYRVDGTLITQYEWHAHRQLADMLLATIRDQLHAQNANFTHLAGIVVFQGPGSFTGLRIGITVANALAYGQNIPVVGATGEDWIVEGLHKLHHGRNDHIVIPEYGAEAHITAAKK